MTGLRCKPLVSYPLPFIRRSEAAPLSECSTLPARLGALAFLFGGAGLASGKERAMMDGQAVEAVIERLIAAPPASRDGVERALGVRLRMTEDNGDWRMFEADGRTPFAPIARIDYRQPAAAGSDQGPHLVMEFADGCPSIEAVRARFGPLEAGPPPSPHAKNATGYWERAYPWGQVSFGYRFLTPKCLSSVVFDLSRRQHGWVAGFGNSRRGAITRQ